MVDPNAIKLIHKTAELVIAELLRSGALGPAKHKNFDADRFPPSTPHYGFTNGDYQ